MSQFNWAAPYNRLFILLDRQGPTHHGGPAFIRIVQQIDQDILNYKQLLDLRASQGRSSSREAERVGPSPAGGAGGFFRRMCALPSRNGKQALEGSAARFLCGGNVAGKWRCA